MTDSLARARGVLWGQAVGDALGTTVEFQNADEVKRALGSTWPERLVGGGPFLLVPGQITDDTELALALARTVAKCGRYDEDEVARAYVGWRRSEPPDVGMATSQAFGGELTGKAITAASVRARASQKTQANGSLMRISPLGIFGSRLERAELAAIGRQDSTLSHPHEVCQAAVAVYVTTIADAIRTGTSGRELYDRALAFAAGGPVEDTLRAAAVELPVSDGDSIGWVRIALQHAFFHLYRGNEYRAAMIETVSCGGDTDTNGSIAGALLGALHGVGGIPLTWRQQVGECESGRPEEYQCHDLDQLGEELLRPR